MSLVRASLVASVAARLTQALSLAGMTSADTTGNMKESTDAALRAMGTVESALTTDPVVATGDEAKALAYTRYFALDTILSNASATRIDVTSPGGGAKLSQAITNLREQWKIAAAEARSFGLAVLVDINAPLGAPFAGGISRADKELRDLDTDRMPPLFDRDLPGGASVADAWRRD